MRRNGFTLLEVSMVLVIIGLIVGGITVGSKLIRNAQLNAVGGEFEKHLAAIKNFQDKFQALPGDLANANTILGGSNGNGDGLIQNAEQFYAWQDLALAGMIDGTFTGADVAGSGGSYDRVPGTNIPASQLSGAGWGLVYVPTNSTDISYQTGDQPPYHVLWFGGKSVTGNNNQQDTVLTTEEAELLDRKYDDGYPLLGKVVVQDNAGTDCNSSNAYSVSTSGKICALVFKTGF